MAAALCLLCLIGLSGEPRETGTSQSAESIAALIDKLATPQALDATRQLINTGVGAVPYLVQALNDARRDTSTRFFAAYALGEIGAATKPVLAALADGVKQKEIAVRLASARSIWKIERRAAPALPILREAMDDNRLPILVSAAQLMSEIGPEAGDNLPKLLAALRRQPANLTDQASSQQMFMIQNHAVTLAKSMGEVAVPALIESLKSESGWDFQVSQRALPEIGAVAVKPIVAILFDSNESVRINSVNTLTVFRQQAADATTSLERLMEDKRPPVRLAAARALFAIKGQASHDVVETLISVLRDGGFIAGRTALLLAQIGKPARDAISELEKTVNSDNLNLAVSSAVALWKVGEINQLEVLRKGVNQPDLPTAWAAIDALGDMAATGQDVVAALPDLLAAMSNPLLQSNVVTALGKIGPSAVDDLVQVVKKGENQPALRATAVDALRAIGLQAASATRVLRQIAVIDPDDHVRTSAELAVREIEQKAESSDVPVTKTRSIPDRDGENR